MGSEAGGWRLAELAIALSLATDLGTGQPLEHGLRTCWSALAAADALGLDAGQRSCAYHVALLRFLGCTSDAAGTAALAGGDDLRFNATMAPMLMAQPGQLARFFVRHLAEELPVRQRVGRVARAVAAPGAGPRSLAQHCEAAARLAGRLGLPPAVCQALAHAYERWDGQGHPDGLAGDDVPLAVRLVTVARDVELWTEVGGWPAAAEVLRRRRGHAYDPDVVDVFLAGSPAWRAAIGDDPCAAVLDAEPAPVLALPGDELDRALEAVADFADLKSPWLRGHSTAVAVLAARAAHVAGLEAEEVTAVRRAGLVHDVGRIGVPNGIWDRPGPLTAEQWERVRLHPYLTERVLHRHALLAPYASLAAAHHERLDGSGYHHARRGAQLDLPARLLAAADAYQARCEDRPHRPGLTGPEAAALLLAEADLGRFAPAEVHAILDAAGQASRPPQVSRPAGLTEREVDVLRLIGRGLSNKEVARRLGISPKTVGRHVEHVYAKAGVTTRAGAALFAMETGLLTQGPAG